LGHIPLNTLDVAIDVIGLEQVLIFEALQFVLPEAENLAVNSRIVARLRVAPIGLIVGAVERAETTSQEGAHDDWYRRARLFPESSRLAHAELSSTVVTPDVAVALDGEAS